MFELDRSKLFLSLVIIGSIFFIDMVIPQDHTELWCLKKDIMGPKGQVQCHSYISKDIKQDFALMSFSRSVCHF